MEALRNHPCLHGLWIGNIANRVPRQEIVDGDGYQGYCIENGRIGSRRQANGPFEDMPNKQQRIDAVLESGGMLCMKSGLIIALKVGDPTSLRIEKIIVAQPLVSKIFAWKDEQAMQTSLGPSDNSEKMAFSVVHHYQIDAHNVAVHWSVDHPRKSLDQIIIGGILHVEPHFTALGLVVEFVEGWDSLKKYNYQEPPASARPTLIRYQRIRALASALDLPSVESIADGSFLDNPAQESQERRAGVLEQLRSIIPDSIRMRYSSLSPLYKPKQIYLDLLQYRHKAEALLSHNAGWLEVGDETLVAMIRHTEAVNKTLKGQLEPIEQILVRMLDPQEPQKQFGQSWLVRTHGFNTIIPREFDTAWDWGFGYDIDE